jgi:hypothetical protein
MEDLKIKKNPKKEIKTKNNQKFHKILQKIKIAPGMVSILNFPDIISAKVHVYDFLFDEQFFNLKCPSDEPCLVRVRQDGKQSDESIFRKIGVFNRLKIS